MVMIAFEPDRLEAQRELNETALFVGVRGDPPLESTQLRWQVRASTNDVVELKMGPTYLQQLGGALFLTTREPRVQTAEGEIPPPIGWMRWIANNGHRSFHIQLAISAIGFDRVCHQAEKGKYPDAILTFQEDGPIDFLDRDKGHKKKWNNVESKHAYISEYTLRYDLAVAPALKETASD
jgi:hypothetical protein